MVINPMLLHKMLVIPLITIFLVLPHRQAMAPELNESQRGSAPVVAISSQVSRGEPAQKAQRRVMRVTAYTPSDKDMNDKGITADGEKALEGWTIAADSSIPLVHRSIFPSLEKRSRSRTGAALSRGIGWICTWMAEKMR